MTRSISGGRALAVSYLSTIGGLLLGTVIGSLGLVLFEMTDECHQWAETLGLLGALPWFVMIAMLFGGLPALILGAPLYAALLSHDLADYLTSAVLGAALVGPPSGRLGWRAVRPLRRLRHPLHRHPSAARMAAAACGRAVSALTSAHAATQWLQTRTKPAAEPGRCDL